MSGCRFPGRPGYESPGGDGRGAVPAEQPGRGAYEHGLGVLGAVPASVEPDSAGDVLARRVMFDGKRATGVEVESNGQAFVVEGGEIIVSSGAVGSPQLLLLSGVGTAEELRPLGIDPVHELPGVGRNMKNHPSVSLMFRPQPGPRLAPAAPRNQVGLRFTAKGSSARNDIQLQLITSYPEHLESHDINLGCRLELPYSEGRLTLASSDPRVQPDLDFGFLTDPRDVARLREAVRQCVQIFENRAFGELLAERISPTDADLADDQSLDAWIQGNVGIAGHVSRYLQDGAGVGPDGGGPILQGTRPARSSGSRCLDNARYSAGQHQRPPSS